MRRGTPYAVVLAAALSLGFVDFSRGPAHEGNRHYAEREFDKALQAYGAALVEDPESPRLNFNMGNALYQLGRYEEAVASYRRVRIDGDDDPRNAKVAYNLGNIHFRLAQAFEAENPQQALEGYAQAMVAYRRAIGADPSDHDAKFNYEFARKALEDLQRRLEEEQPDQEQEQQNPNQEQQPEPDEQEQQGEQQPQQQEAEDEPQPEPQDQSSAPDSGEEEHAQDPPQGDPAADESDVGEEMTPREAAALVDMARDEELRPEDFIREMHGAAVGEALYDW